MCQDHNTLQKSWESKVRMARITVVREMETLEGQATFEHVESKFKFTRCIRQGNVETPEDAADELGFGEGVFLSQTPPLPSPSPPSPPHTKKNENTDPPGRRRERRRREQTQGYYPLQPQTSLGLGEGGYCLPTVGGRS